MAAKTKLNWIKNYAFETEIDGFTFNLDIAEESGGNNLGPRPKPLLLSALSGCSGMDTVGILRKMRVEDYKLEINVEADIAEEHPKVYTAIRMTYNFTGESLPADKVINAVELSITKYCAVYAMLKAAAPIKTIININEQEVWNA